MSLLLYCGWCCMLLSIWAVIQLIFMGIFFKMEVVAFIEEAEAHDGEYDTYNEFIEKTKHNYDLGEGRRVEYTTLQDGRFGGSRAVGLNSDIVRVIYLAVVEPTILYVSGPPPFRKCTSVKTTFAIKISKSHRTYSFPSIVLIASILLLDLRAFEQKDLYEIKIGKPFAEYVHALLERRVHLQAVLFFDIKSANRILVALPKDNLTSLILTGQLKLSDTPYCVCGSGDVESISHVLLSCSRFTAERFDLESRIGRPEVELADLVSDEVARPSFVEYAGRVMAKAARLNGSTI